MIWGAMIFGDKAWVGDGSWAGSADGAVVAGLRLALRHA